MAYTYKPFTQDDELNLLEFNKDTNTTYREPESVTNARDRRDTYEANNNPGAWDADGAMWNEVTAAQDDWKNREAFSYDVNGDALYQQYKDKYINQGRLAMADTIGQASAMTGGYGSSYATTAGSQAYQSHLQSLNDIVPQLYQMAYDRYTQEGQDLKDAYSMVYNNYQTKYGEHRDSVSDYNTNLSRLDSLYNDERTYQYGVFDSNRTYSHNAYYDAYNKAYQAHTDEQNRLYQEERDRVADAQWQASYNLQKEAASKASYTEKYEGISFEDSETLQGLYEDEDWDAIDRFIGSLAVSSKTRKELQDLWLPEDYGKLKDEPPKMVWNPRNSPWNTIN